jgi:pyridoxal phosphate-dependent aminotransferase EpsN
MNKKTMRIPLSVPHAGTDELAFVKEAFESNWISTVGPHITAFEEECSAMLGVPTLAVSSGTAALHLALRLVGVTPGDEVLCSTLSFVAAPNAIRYLDATPVFIDSDYDTWNLNPALLAETLASRALSGKLPRALIVVHLYGQCADMDPILETCRAFGVSVIEDAAEAVGAKYKGKYAGTLGDVGVYSFNGNKIITTAGGGLLMAPSQRLVEKARFWSTQAKDPGISYQHSELGHNYRMSNVLAAIGLGQLRVLSERVRRRREIAFRYAEAFSSTPGIELMPQAEYGLHTNWLSCFRIQSDAFGATRDELISELQKAQVESRPVWRPMHLQPLYCGYQCYGGDVAENLHKNGICLPSSSSLSESDQQLVIDVVLALHRFRNGRATRSRIGTRGSVSLRQPAETIY